MGASGQDRDDTEAVALPGPLRLKKPQSSNVARTLLLEAGDLIVAVNGNSWTRLASVEKAVTALVERGTAPVLLTVWRNGISFHVFTKVLLDGAWDVVAPQEAQLLEGAQPFLTAKEMRRFGSYAIFTDITFAADVVELRTSLLAMFAPPFWFTSRRLWQALVAFLCIVLTAFTISPVFGLCAYLILCVYVGRKQVALIQFAMARDAKRKVMVLSATSETEAQSVALRFHPKLKFRFGPNTAKVSGDVDIGLV